MLKKNEEKFEFLNDESEEWGILSNDTIMCIWDCITLLGAPISFVLLVATYEIKYGWLLLLSMCLHPISIKIVWKWFDKLSIIADLIPFALWSLLGYLMAAMMAVGVGGPISEYFVLKDLGKRIRKLLKGREKKD